MWSCCPKYEYYEISEAGEVRDTILGLTIEPKINRAGYLTVYLPYARPRCRKRNGEFKYTHSLHTVVANTFLPPPKLGQTIVDHIDHNRLNPHKNNLRWLSPAANNYNRSTTRGYYTTKYEDRKIIKAPMGHVFPCIWVRDQEGKRSRVYNPAIPLADAPTVVKLIRENLIATMIESPLSSSADLIFSHKE